MDKYEYKVRADEIKELIAHGEYVTAAEIADTIDWRRVKSVMMLCTISDLYKINRRYEDARNMLLLAYERRPGGRTICYSLCELSIKMEDFVPAVNYYKEFVQVAPKDPGRYILQYKLYEAQDVSLEERIGVLEELKKRDYREKWAYELAYLYHRVGLATRCVEECDELILWFGEGKYVVKAMELKMLHQPLSVSQQERYDHRFDGYAQSPYEPQRTVAPQESIYYPQEQAAPVYGSSVHESAGLEAANYEVGGKTKIYELVSQAEQSKQPMEQDTPIMQDAFPAQEEFSEQETYVGGETYFEQREFAEQESYPEQEASTAFFRQAETGQSDDMDIQVKTMDMGQYNTINLQAEIAAGLREVLEDDGRTSREDAITRAIMAPMMESETESLDLPEIDEVDENDLEPEAEVMEESEVFFGETGEIGDIQRTQEMREDAVQELVPEINTLKDTVSEVISVTTESVEEFKPQSDPKPAVEPEAKDVTAELVMEQLKRESRGEEQVLTAQPPKELAGVLSQESDGQIRLVMPESEQIEKQITGQMSLEDILVEWERMKQENAEKRKEEVRQHVLRHTGEMFTAFEAAVRDGLLEQLENNDEEVPEEDSAEDVPGGENIAADVTVEEVLMEEDPEQGLTEEAPEDELLTEDTLEGEDWDSRPFGESSEEMEVSGEFGEAEAADQEVVFEESDEVEEIEEIQEPAEELNEADASIEEAAEEAGEVERAEGTDADEALAKADQEAAFEESDEGQQPGEAESHEADASAQEETYEPEKAAQHPSPEREHHKARSLTKEEKELYGPYIQSRASREQLVKAIDAISMAAYTGNIIITGEEGMDTVSLAKNMIREMQMTDSNFAGKVAKISGHALNKKDVAATLNPLASGALIIQKASAMSDETVKMLHKALQKESFGIIIVLEDTKKAMNKFLEAHSQLAACFTARMDVEALSNDTLVAFGRQYAREKEYAIDELGILALHTRIDEMQTIDHVVTVLEVKELVDNAIYYANRKNVKHFMDILFARRYDDEDMIILSEKDFVH